MLVLALAFQPPLGVYGRHAARPPLNHPSPEAPASGIPSEASHDRFVLMRTLRLQPPLRVNGRNAARSGGGDGLPINVVVHVPGGEDALDVRL